MLQKLTTRIPDHSQIEVAAAAMNSTLAADGVIPAGGPSEDASTGDDGPLRREPPTEGQEAAEGEAK